MAKLIDLTGKQFGKWKVLERDPTPRPRGTKAYWICKCTCGTVMPVNSGNLKRGKSTSCKQCANKSIVFGFGVNDSNEPTNDWYYKKWIGMIRRCYDPTFKEHDATYINTTVCDEWRSRTAFTEWAKAQVHEKDWHLDKDILGDGTIYSPSTCVFVPKEINGFFAGGVGTGVNLKENRLHLPKPYIAQIYAHGTKVHLGIYATEQQATDAYNVAKCAEIERLLKVHSRIDGRVLMVMKELL